MKFKFVVFIFFAVILFFCSCAKKEDSPSKVFETTMNNISSGNSGEAWNSITSESRAKLKSKEQFSALLSAALSAGDLKEKITQVKLVNEKVDNDKAILTVRYPSAEAEGGVKNREIECLKEDGSWKINISELMDEIME